MKYPKIILMIVICLHIFTVAAFSTEAAVVGTIQSEEAQGNNYLELTVKADNDKVIHVLCSGQKTQVFVSATPVYWNELKPEQQM